MPEPKKLYLIDGMSHVFRAFYAIRGLSNSKGMATNAIFGFTSILRKLIADEHPDYICMALDSDTPTFRHVAYEAYKANRSAFPEDLAPQMPYILRVCEVLRIPMVRIPGFEADDIIGTLAKRAAQEELTAVIVSNDKDMCQLVGDHVFILRADKNGNSLIDAKGVEERMGVRPDQIVDLLGLWGDSSDNIPGAPGIGEKGALALIQQFGSIEEALRRYEEVSRKAYRESLRDNKDIILQSRELATIHCECPCDFTLESLKFQEPDRAAAYQLFTELEFTQLRREFSDAATSATVAQAEKKSEELSYSKLTSENEIKSLSDLVWARDSFSFDVFEEAGRIRGLALSLGSGQANLIDFADFGDKLPIEPLKDLLSNGLLRKSVHDWKRAIYLLNSLPVQPGEGNLFNAAGEANTGAAESSLVIDGVEDDTMLAAYLLNPIQASYNLPELSRAYLGLPLIETLDGFDANQLTALRAADLSGQLAEALSSKVKEQGLEQVYREIELPLVPILYDLERVGVRIDPQRLAEISDECEAEMARLSEEIYRLAGRKFNIGSPTQLAEIFEELNIESGRKTKTGKVSTSHDVLEELALRYELPALIVSYREVSKLQSTYVVALPKMIDPHSGRIHTTFNQTVAATGRLSSTNPNLQNIPVRSELGRRIRAAFIPCEGCQIMSADYSQIELRLLAHIAQDTEMIRSFRNNEDVHAATARRVFNAVTPEEQAEKRRLAKIVNFAIAYVVGPFGLAQRTGLSRKEAKEVIDNYYATYSGIKRYMEETPERAREKGVVRTLFGRIRPIPEINNANHNLRARAEREAVNAPIQGTASDIIKLAMIEIDKALKRERMTTRMTLQVHDELVFEVPDNEIDRAGALVKEAMENVMKLDVPLLVDIGVGANWMLAKP